jgi:YD repeat-containing protein
LTGTGGVPSEYRAKMAKLLAEVFANETFATTTYAYDANGRVVERQTRMGNLSDDRTRFKYNDRTIRLKKSSSIRAEAPTWTTMA